MIDLKQTCGVFWLVAQGKFDTSLHNPSLEKSNHSTAMIMIIAVADTIIDLFTPLFSHSQTMLLSIIPYLVTRLSMKYLAPAVTICRVLCEMNQSRTITLNVKLCDYAHISSFIFHTQSSILQSRRLLVFLSTINCDNTEQQCVEAHHNVHTCTAKQSTR